jgi:hypothetical protein
MGMLFVGASLLALDWGERVIAFRQAPTEQTMLAGLL